MKNMPLKVFNSREASQTIRRRDLPVEAPPRVSLDNEGPMICPTARVSVMDLMVPVLSGLNDISKLAIDWKGLRNVADGRFDGRQFTTDLVK